MVRKTEYMEDRVARRDMRQPLSQAQRARVWEIREESRSPLTPSPRAFRPNCTEPARAGSFSSRWRYASLILRQGWDSNWTWDLWNAMQSANYPKIAQLEPVIIKA